MPGEEFFTIGKLWLCWLGDMQENLKINKNSKNERVVNCFFAHHMLGEQQLRGGVYLIQIKNNLLGEDISKYLENHTYYGSVHMWW